MPQHCLHHRFRAVHGIMFIPGLAVGNQVIAIVPCFGFLKVHLILFAESGHFRFGKAKILCQFTGVSHGILGEHIQRRMRAILFDGQNTRHVGQCNIIFVFQPCPQKIQILFLCILILLVFPEQAVPLVNQNHERPLCFGIYVFHDLNEIAFISEAHILKMVG